MYVYASAAQVASGIPFDTSYFFSLFSEGVIWRAAGVTVELTVAVWASSLVLGFLTALMLRSRRRPVRALAATYVLLFRSLPPLLLIIFAYTGLPVLIPSLESFLSSPFAAGYIALVAAATAFMAEVFRGSLLGVEIGQREAARIVGLNSYRTYRHVVLPQALRIALPALGNEFIGVLKGSSLVSVISLAELTLVAQQISSENFRVLEVLSAVGVVYIMLASVFMVLQRLAERALDVTRGNPMVLLGLVPADLARSSEEQLGVPDDALHDSSSGQLVKVDRVDVRGGEMVASDVQKRFGSLKVLHGIDLTVSPGEVVVLIGPSGSGKTTLLRCISGLETTDAGWITVDGHPVGAVESRRRRSVESHPRSSARVGLVFQRFNLFANLSALDNVALGPRVVRGLSRKDAEEAARSLLKDLGLATHVHHYPHQLSGGQQQRVAIARALAMDPEVLLFDEPTSALDPELVHDVVSVVAGLANRGLTMVIVSHEMRFVRRVATRIVVMDAGDIIETNDPDTLFQHPQHPRSKEFVSRLL